MFYGTSIPFFQLIVRSTTRSSLASVALWCMHAFSWMWLILTVYIFFTFAVSQRRNRSLFKTGEHSSSSDFVFFLFSFGNKSAIEKMFFWGGFPEIGWMVSLIWDFRFGVVYQRSGFWLTFPTHHTAPDDLNGFLDRAWIILTVGIASWVFILVRLRRFRTVTWF